MQFLHLPYSRRQDLFQAQRLPGGREERGAGVQTGQRGGSRLMALRQPLQVKVAQVLHLVFVERTAMIGGASIRQLGSPEPSALELPPHMQLDRGCWVTLIASTATPALRQLTRQADATTVF